MTIQKGRYKLRDERRCRMCLRPERVRPLTRHHLVPLSRDGGWCNQNIVPLCRPCHDLIDCGPHLGRRLWRSMLRRLLTPGELSYARRALGQPWLDREYPPRVPFTTPFS